MLDLFKNIIRKSKDKDGSLPESPPGPNQAESVTSGNGMEGEIEDALEVQRIIAKNSGVAVFYEELSYRYHLSDVLGEGAFSVVYKAHDSVLKKDIAIKIIKKQSMKKEQIESTRREIAIMRRLDHANITRLYSFQNSDSSKFCFLFMELVSGGELFNQIIKYTYFSEDLTRHIMRQVAHAVKHLHDRGIVHRDIKPENLLFEPCKFFPRPPEDQLKARRHSDDNNKIDEGLFIKNIGAGSIGVVKLADFGLSIDLGETGSTLAKTPCGTVGYTSPEQHMNIGYDKKVDIWAIGCVLYTMVVGFPPFYSNTQDTKDISKKVANGDYQFLKPWFDEVSVECKNLISNLLTVNPQNRYSIDQLLNDPWMNIGYEDSINMDTNPAADAPGSHFDPALYQTFQKSLINTSNIDDYFSGNKLSSCEQVVTPRAEAIKLVFGTATQAQRTQTSLLSPSIYSNKFSNGITDTLCISSMQQKKILNSSSDLSDLDSEDSDEFSDTANNGTDHHNNHATKQSNKILVAEIYSPSDLESEDSEFDDDLDGQEDEDNDEDDEDDEEDEFENSNIDDNEYDEETDRFIKSMGSLRKINSPRFVKSSRALDSIHSPCITPVQSHATATTVTTVMTVGSNSPKQFNHSNNVNQQVPFSIHGSMHSAHSKLSSKSNTTNTQSSKSSLIQISPKALIPSSNQNSREGSIIASEIHDQESCPRRKSSISFQIAPRKSIASSSSSLSSEKSINLQTVTALINNTLKTTDGKSKIDEEENEDDISCEKESTIQQCKFQGKRGDSKSLLNKNGKNEEEVEGDETELDIDADTPKACSRLSFGAECEKPHRTYKHDMKKKVLTHTPFVPHKHLQVDDYPESSSNRVATPIDDLNGDAEDSINQKFISRGVFDLQLNNSTLLSRRKQKITN